MNAPTIARILGLLLLVTGIAGFIPWAASPAPLDAPVMSLDSFYRFIAGLLPVNFAHDALHLVFGACAFLAAARFGAAVGYCRVATWTFAMLAVLGALPVFAFYTLFGAAPLFGWDVAFNAAIAILAAYGGYGAGSIETEATLL